MADPGSSIGMRWFGSRSSSEEAKPLEGSGGPPYRQVRGSPEAGRAPEQTGGQTRRNWRWRTRDASAAAVGSLGAGVVLLARLVLTVATLIALLIGLAIILRDVDANARNTIVKGIHEGANFFAGAFTGLITFNGHAKRAITVDWGIAVLVYAIAGAAIAGAIRRIGRRGLLFEQSHRPAL